MAIKIAISRKQLMYLQMLQNLDKLKINRDNWSSLTGLIRKFPNLFTLRYERGEKYIVKLREYRIDKCWSKGKVVFVHIAQTNVITINNRK